MLCISRNGGSWFGLDNRPRQFLRGRKWWGGVRDGWKYGWRCLTVSSSRFRLIKFWNMDFLSNFMNVASIKLKENCQNIVTCSPFLLNKAQKSMRGLFSGVPPTGVSVIDSMPTSITYDFDFRQFPTCLSYKKVLKWTHLTVFITKSLSSCGTAPCMDPIWVLKRVNGPHADPYAPTFLYWLSPPAFQAPSRPSPLQKPFHRAICNARMSAKCW